MSSSVSQGAGKSHSQVLSPRPVASCLPWNGASRGLCILGGKQDLPPVIPGPDVTLMHVTSSIPEALSLGRVATGQGTCSLFIC